MNKLIVANWKMNCSIDEATSLLQHLQNIACDNDIVVCPSFAHLYLAKEFHLTFGAQNCAATENGAFTGEISAAMLKDMGCRYVILGHSERRQLFQETDSTIKTKLNKAIEHGLTPIVCIGEPLDTYKAGKTKEYIKSQLDNLELPAHNIAIAYEPIWAIGSGLIPSIEEVSEILAFITSYTHNQFRTLYGGSVSDKNCISLADIKDLDGFLVGGASLKIEQFKTICHV